MLRGPEARLRLISLMLVTVLLPIVGKLLQLQVLEHSLHAQEAKELVEREYRLPDPPWGCIQDRHGDLLVGNQPLYDVGAEIQALIDPADVVEAAAKLAPLLGRPVAEVLDDLTPNEAERDNAIIWRILAKNVPTETAEELKALIEEEGYLWITLLPTWSRYYAEGDLAAHTLGFVNARGLGFGIEAYWSRFLRGGQVVGEGPTTGFSEPTVEELATGQTMPYAGTDLRLTLDRTIQAYVEGELDKALEEYSAESGAILVLNPRTGEILALATRPSYNPARYAEHYEAGEQAIFQNPVISVPYEPGSVFKVVTIASVLDSGRVDLNWTYDDTGSLEYGGIVVYNSDREAHGRQGVQGILARSSNVGAATLTTQILGAETFYNYVQAFGFGQKTGVELSGENAGTVHMSRDWDWEDSNLATNAFGQGIAVTPMQMAAAVSAIANDGVLMQPYIVAERHYPDGRSVLVPPREVMRPISAETAQTVSELMARALEERMP
ncbi:MAG: peptidoglycan D,D-transpeptidase FtsI family protein, partial [Anaerolineae bacterium]